MAFIVADFKDFMQLLNEHPEWRSELRRQILDEEFLKLPEYVRALDARLGRVEVSVGKLEVNVDKLAEAQARTEYRLGRVEDGMSNLEDRMSNLEDGMSGLNQSHKGLATAIAQLQTAFGSTVEEEAESVLRWVLEGKGYRLLGDPVSLPLNGEVDVIVEVESPSGERMWAVVEAKARLGYRQVRSWGQQMQSEGWQRRLAEAGVPGPFLVYAYGIRYDPGAVQAAEEQKIGLMSLKGERVIPQGVIYTAEAVQ